MKHAEFDDYAAGYEAGMENAAKRIAGASPVDFLRPKIDLLRAVIDPIPAGAGVLDFGCGTGEFLALIRERWPELQLEGCDLSQGMLDEAHGRGKLAEVALWKYDGGELPCERYDVITAVCVFHHIPPDEWVVIARHIRGALKPGGKFVLIEHNPWNPVTSWVVARTPIDENAVMLSIPTAKWIFKEAGFKICLVRNFMFAPPRFRVLHGVERMLGGVPFGGQYFLVASAV